MGRRCPTSRARRANSLASINDAVSTSHETRWRRRCHAMSHQWSASRPSHPGAFGRSVYEARNTAYSFMRGGCVSITKNRAASPCWHAWAACVPRRSANALRHAKIPRRLPWPEMVRGKSTLARNCRDRFSPRERFVVGGVPPAPTPLTTPFFQRNALRLDLDASGRSVAPSTTTPGTQQCNRHAPNGARSSGNVYPVREQRPALPPQRAEVQ